MTFPVLYFAYGSNMDHGQMSFRTPGARYVGAAFLDGWQLEFRGVANVRPETGGVAPGSLWLLTPECLEALDRYEGYPYSYGREFLPVRRQDGRVVEALVYVMTGRADSDLTAPWAGYYEGIARGYRHAGHDARPLRAARTEALKAEESQPRIVREFFSVSRYSGLSFYSEPEPETCIECGHEFDTNAVSPGTPELVCEDCWTDSLYL